jgi:hypothetical protein
MFEYIPKIRRNPTTVQFSLAIGINISITSQTLRRRSQRARQYTSLLEKDLAQVLK